MHKSARPTILLFIVFICSPVSGSAQQMTLNRTAREGIVLEAVRQLDDTTALRITEENGSTDQFPLEIRDDRKPEFVHPIRFESVKAMSLSDNQHEVAIIGSVDTHPEIVVVDRGSERVAVELPVFRAAMSPDGKLLAFEHFRARTDQSTAKYSIIASTNFQFDGSLAHPPRAVFPTDSKVHAAHSDLYWVRNGVLAFLDYDGTDTCLVVMQVGPSGTVDRLVEHKLDPDLLVDRAVIDPGAPPPIAIWAEGISALSQPGLTIRLMFNSVNIKVRRADIAIW